MCVGSNKCSTGNFYTSLINIEQNHCAMEKSIKKKKVNVTNQIWTMPIGKLEEII